MTRLMLSACFFLTASAFTHPNAALTQRTVSSRIFPRSRAPGPLNFLPEAPMVLAESGSVDVMSALPAVVAGCVITILLAGLPVIFVQQEKSSKNDKIAAMQTKLARVEGIATIDTTSSSEVASSPVAESSTESEEAKQRGTI